LYFLVSNQLDDIKLKKKQEKERLAREEKERKQREKQERLQKQELEKAKKNQVIVSEPLEVKHYAHVGTDLKWSGDPAGFSSSFHSSMPQKSLNSRKKLEKGNMVKIFVLNFSIELLVRYSKLHTNKPDISWPLRFFLEQILLQKQN
jgi:hypothetical protein